MESLTRSLPGGLWTAVVCVCLAACGGRSSGPAHKKHSTAPLVVINGVSIRIEPPLQVQGKSLTSMTIGEDGGVTMDGARILGYPFGIRDGEFHIGDHKFSAVAAGQLVRVSEDGIYVGDERRGDLPAARK